MQLRDDNASLFKNYWTLFGGDVEPSESPTHAILRELREEISLLPSQINSLKQVQSNVQKRYTSGNL